MISKIVKSLVVGSVLMVSASAFAQSGNAGSGNTGGSGSMGSGSSAGFGIDFFAGSAVGGSNSDKAGGFVNAIEAAFGTPPNAQCGKPKCD